MDNNIILGRYGETIVVDWGLAKVIGRADPGLSNDEEPVTPSSSGNGVETLAGRAYGTPQFMSPEQASGDLDRIGPASDIYSLGATLYRMVTGRLPYGGATPAEARHNHMALDVPLTPPDQINPDLSRGLVAVIRIGMRRQTPATKPRTKTASARTN